MFTVSRIAVLGLVLILAACGGDAGPSDADVARAAKDHLVKALAAQQPMTRLALGEAGAKAQLDKMTAEVQSMDVAVGQKVKQQDGSYSVTVTFRKDQNSKVQTLKLLKGADGWVAAD